MTRLDEVKQTVVDLMQARATEDRAALVRLTGDLTTESMRRPYDVVVYMASVAGARLRLAPGETFHRLRVEYRCDKGHVHEGSAEDLPPGPRVFSQMAVAAANRDVAMVRDLFLGYVQRKRTRATELLIVGATVLVRQAAADGVGPS